MMEFDKEKEKQIVAYHLRSRRQSLGMSQSEFGKIVGVSGANISHWETGKRVPAAHTYLMLMGKESR